MALHWTKQPIPSIIETGRFVMVGLLWLLLSLAPLAATAQQAAPEPPPAAGAPPGAEGVIQLPDVTLFGQDRVYLPAPGPNALLAVPELPLEGGRSPMPRSDRPLLLGEPEAGEALRLTPPAAAAAPPGLMPPPQDGDRMGNPVLESGDGDGGGLSLQLLYVPLSGLGSQISYSAGGGPWDTRGGVSLLLADGWLGPRPTLPARIELGWDGRWSGESLGVELEARGGACYPEAEPAAYALDLAATLSGTGVRSRWSERTSLSGQSVPGEAEQVGLAGQQLEAQAVGPLFGAWGWASGYVRAGLPEGTPTADGMAVLQAGLTPDRSWFRLWGGLGALYYMGQLGLVPVAALDLFPAPLLTVRTSAAPFLKRQSELELGPEPAPEPGPQLPPAGVPTLAVEGGYSVSTRISLDAPPRAGAELGLEYLTGTLYHEESGVWRLGPTEQARLEGELSWRIILPSEAGAGLRLLLSGQASGPFPPTSETLRASWRGLLGSRLVLDFSKVPLQLIMGVLWGELADDEEQAFLGSEGGISPGLAVSLRGTVTVQKRYAFSAGAELLLGGAGQQPAWRFLIGYGARRP
jgi:hypothetical protein